MRRVLVILVLVVMSAVLVSCETAEETTTTAHATRPTTVPVKLMGTEGYREGGYEIVTGKVWNDGTTSVRGVLMRATILSADGKVVNTDTAYIDSDVLAPGASATFTVMVADPNKEATRYNVRVEDYRR